MDELSRDRECNIETHTKIQIESLGSCTAYHGTSDAEGKGSTKVFCIYQPTNLHLRQLHHCEPNDEIGTVQLTGSSPRFHDPISPNIARGVICSSFTNLILLWVLATRLGVEVLMR